MSEQLDWTQKLGDAVLAQQADVMDAVQRLRLKAQQANYLKTTKEQTVTVVQGGAAGEPGHRDPAGAAASKSTFPTMIRTLVYPGWGYSAYPPYYWPPPYGYYGYYPGWYPGRALAAGVAFGIGVAWVNRIGGAI